MHRGEEIFSYYPFLAENSPDWKCADWIMAPTPGDVDQDLERLGYKRIKRPMFPLDKNMPAPELSARLISSSGKL